MKWIPGYRIAGKGLYAPSGMKIADIWEEWGGEFTVSPAVPGLDWVDTSEAESVESACLVLIHAHAKQSG